MTAFTGDIQILLYTEEVDFSACRDFYQTLLGQEPYYSWNEGTQDRGAKFRAGCRHPHFASDDRAGRGRAHGLF